MVTDDDPLVDSVDEQALEWVVRLTSGAADTQMLTAFECWRDVDPSHEIALARARQLWLALERPLESQPSTPIAVSCVETPRPRRWSGQLWAAVAVLAVVAVGLGRHWLVPFRYDQVTSVGEQRSLTLADGSRLSLNTNSAVDIDITAQHRRIQLVRGEAYFDVRPDAARPFIVAAADRQVTVLGTTFDVRRDENEVTVIVQSGRVEVAAGAGTRIVLARNQRVISRPGELIQHVDEVNADLTLLWRDGKLVFENQPLEEIVHELARYSSRTVLVRDPQAALTHLDAMVDLAHLDEWYDSLQQSLPVQVKHVGPAIWIGAPGRTQPE